MSLVQPVVTTLLASYRPDRMLGSDTMTGLMPGIPSRRFRMLSLHRSSRGVIIP